MGYLSPARLWLGSCVLLLKTTAPARQALSQGSAVIRAITLPFQDEAGLTKTFQTWPRGWFHIPLDPDFPVPS